jgi:hypothetical protein
MIIRITRGNNYTVFDEEDDKAIKKDKVNFLKKTFTENSKRRRR